MKTYLVGGAVRDKLLDLHVSDRDWVVVGATIDEMLAQGFQQVGKDFPVFLHPQSKEEYALARTERKSGKGYTGFECISDSSVTLEQDLLRRDLTINAIAEDGDGQLVDPYGGVEDLKNRTLRHVSAAFAEDPLRVLRVARFAARFASRGFTIADETMNLMQQMANSGELDELTAERVWKETEKALASDTPDTYFQVLRDCNALKILFPEIDVLFGVPQTEKHHPEIDTGIHTLMVLQQAAKLSDDIGVRFAALTHDLGKGITPKETLPRHIEHETQGIPLVEQLCERLRVPKNISDLARLVCEFHLHSHRAMELKAKTVEKLFRRLDLYRRPERLKDFVQACEADARGRLGFELHPYPQADYLRQCFQAAAAITIKDIDTSHLQGPAIGEALQRAKVRAIANVKASYSGAQAEKD